MEELALPEDCIHVEITEEMAKAATAADFTCDNELWVCALDAEGAAAGAGVTAGMALVGFGKRALHSSATWAAVRQAAASADHPHVFSFAQTDAEAGAAAVARYEERQAQRAKEEAAEKERLEKARAAGEKRKAEVEDALAMLTADDEVRFNPILIRF